jgi:hypothetical protein
MRFIILHVLCALALMTSALATAETRNQCDFDRMQNELVKTFGLTEFSAKSYTLAFENFLTTLDLLNVRLKFGVYQQDLSVIKYELINVYKVSEERADYLVTTIKLVRMQAEESGIRSADLRCLGEE